MNESFVQFVDIAVVLKAKVMQFEFRILWIGNFEWVIQAGEVINPDPENPEQD